MASNGVTRSWKVYGRPGHRQHMSFSESVRWDFSDKLEGIRILDIENADKTGTNDYTIIHITRNTAKECADELEVITPKEFWPFPSYGDLLYSIR